MVDCIKCGKCLKTIGKDRKNGKGNYNDWDSRELHKKCWKELKDFQDCILFNNYYDDDLRDKMLKNFKDVYKLDKLL